MASEHRRVILVGKTGNGKSSTGNNLLGGSVFTAGDSLSPVTKTCQINARRRDQMQYTVVDSPGLMDTEVNMGTRLLQIQSSVEICLKPHAFLLIFSSTNRMTRDEEYTIDLLRVAFGEKVFDHCIVVFTHGARFKTDQEFDNFWKESGMIVELVKRCKGRILRIENSNPVGLGGNEYVNRITEMIETLSTGGIKTYQYGWIDVHKRVLQEHLEKYDGTGDLKKELSVLANSLGNVLNKEVWTVMLVGGALTAVGAVGVGAAGYGAYLAGEAVVGMASSGTLGAIVANGAAAVSTVAATAWSLASKAKFW